MAESVTVEAGGWSPALTPNALRDIAAMLDVLDETLRYLIPFAPAVPEDTKAAAIGVVSGDDMQRTIRAWADAIEAGVTTVTTTSNVAMPLVCEWCGSTDDVRLRQREYLCMPCRTVIECQNILSAVENDRP